MADSENSGREEIARKYRRVDEVANQFNKKRREDL